jgi:CHAT domain-containing protein
MGNLKEIFERLPQAVKRITIVADDLIHAFPFAMVSINGVFLIEKYALSYAHHNDILLNRSVKSMKLKRTALLVGVTKSDKNISALPGVTTELQALEKFLNRKNFSINTLLDEHVTKTKLFELLSNSCFFHIAAHGRFDREHPDQTGILLSNGNILSLFDILTSNNFEQTLHAVITSCWAADHFIVPGRWVIGLPEALTRKGVKGVLGCLWKVDDSFSSTFIESYYDNLQNFPPDVALQKTQQKAFQNHFPGFEDSTNPLLWGGFNFYGNINFPLFNQV